MSDEAIRLVVVALFYLLALGIGLWAARRRTVGRGADELLLAGRRLPFLVGVFTLTATWVGGGYINGTAEQVYSNGLVWAQAPWCYALSLLLGAAVFTRIMHRHRFTTMLDPFERRYGTSAAAALAIPALLGEIFWSAAILMALGSTFGAIVDIDIRVAILISAAVAIVYTLLGGLWSVVYTDVVQVIFILGGLGLALPFALDKAGGLVTMISNYTETLGSSASPLPPLAAFSGGGEWGLKGWLWLDQALLLVCGGIAWQVYFQRILACPTERAAVRLSLFACAGVLLLAAPPVLMGAIGATIDWEAAGAPPPESAAMILPHVLRYLTPSLVAVVGLGAVAAAVMSSVDSSILSTSSMLVWNVYRPLFWPGANDRELRRAIRVAVVATGALATLLALKLQSVYVLWYLCSDLVYAILFPQLLMALYFKRANVIGATAGAILGLVLRLGGGEPLIGLPSFLPYPMNDPEAGVLFPFRTFSMLANLTTIWIVSCLTARLCPPRPLGKPP